MSRYQRELSLATNIIDATYQPQTTPADLVERWAAILLKRLAEEHHPDFARSPLLYMAAYMRGCNSSAVLQDLVDWTAGGLDECKTELVKAAFLGYCAERFDAHGHVIVNAPYTFVRTEMLTAMNELIRMFEDNAELMEDEV